MLKLNEVARDPVTDLPLQAGAFGLVKKVVDGRVVVRLIIDRRSQNHYEHVVSGLHMPHSSCFTKLALGPNQQIRLSLRDASIFYYLLQAPKERLPYQGLGPSVSREWWEAGCPDWSPARVLDSSLEQIQPVFLAVAMGD
jgi:hypothetical protein